MAAPGSGGAPTTPQIEEAHKLSQYYSIIQHSPWYHQLFVLLVVAQLFFTAVERSVLLSLHTPSTDSLYYFGLLVISAAFALYYGIHSIIAVSYMELAAFRIVTFFLLLRIIIEYLNQEEECSSGIGAALCLTFMILSIAFNIVTFAITVWMLPDLRWKRYKAIGAEVHTQTMYRRFELFSAVRKVDLQFSIITLFTGILFCVSNLSLRTSQFTLGANVGCFIIEGLWEVLGDRAVKREHELYMYAFWSLSVFQLSMSVVLVFMLP